MFKLTVFKDNLAYRLVVYILLFSSGAVVLSTALQLFFEYKRDIGHMQTTFEQIGKSHVATIIPSLWVYDLAMLTTQLQGIKNLPDVSCVSIQKNDGQDITIGVKATGGASLSARFPLAHIHRGEEQQLGTLVVDMSLSGVYQRLWNRVILIVASQMLQTFLIAVFIFILFYFIVGRHLKTMAAFARSISLKNLDTALILHRKPGIGSAHDELDLVESAINGMRTNLIREMNAVRNAQDALAQSEQRFRSLVANIPGIVYRCELAPPWQVDYISDPIENISGYPAQDFLSGSMAFGQLVHPHDLAKVTAAVDRQIADQSTFEIEYRILDKDGRIRWVLEKGKAVYDGSGKPLWLDGVILEITDKKQTEKRLAEKDLLLHSIIENTSDAIFFKDAQGRYLLANTATAKAIGRPEEEVVGKTDFELFAKESAETIRHNDDQVMTSAKALIAEENLLTAYGETYWQTNKSPLFDVQGTFLGLVGISRNITELKLSQKHNEELERKFLQAQKMESVGRLAGGVAHDFNNMLNVILGHAEMALEEVADGSPLQGDLREIKNAAERSADLTRQLLAFARKQTVAPKVLDLNETVEGMLKMLRRLIGENITLSWRPGGTSGMVKMDPTQIEQMLANMCINAKDAIEDTGRITIETRGVTFDEEYCAEHPGFFPGEYVQLAVSDNGSGMSPEVLANLFEPFFTTKEIGKGTGLGLATVYGIVKQNHGFINVYSEPAQGTTFKIYLARHQEAEIIPTVRKETAPPPVRGKEHILLVEDEPQLIKMATIMLERQGYTVLAAATPQDAMRLAREYSEQIDLLMTDVVMPEMNGRDLAKSLLTLSPHLKCLFMSGYTANVIAHHGVLDEGVHFIQKPFSIGDLAAKVREVLDEER